MDPNAVLTAWVAIVLTLPFSTAVAQTPAPSPPGAAASAPPEPAKKPTTRKEARVPKEGADARLCLELPTDLLVIRCAEKYRLDRRDT